ncbi:hypothetical protein B0H11DRAFT_1944182 [Mycena galericulata]|nr:hypothetical protein B0H11DRAFT_1944182 [Mycena galericulata]
MEAGDPLIEFGKEDVGASHEELERVTRRNIAGWTRRSREMSDITGDHFRKMSIPSTVSVDQTGRTSVEESVKRGTSSSTGPSNLARTSEIIREKSSSDGTLSEPESNLIRF